MLEIRPWKIADWYVVDAETAKRVSAAPGVRCDERSRQWLIHRTHLPLLDVSPAPVDSALPVWGDGVTQLRPHQVASAQFIRQRRGTLLADGMRVGKTAAIVASHDASAGPLIVAGPLATRSVWMSWFRRRWPYEKIVALRGLTYDPAQFDGAVAVFVHYPILWAWVSLAMRTTPGTLVFDEAHILANARSKAGQNATTMAPAAQRIVCATGTPLWNSPASLHSILNLCSPASWGNYFAFTERYAGGHPGAHGWEIGEPTNVDEFKTRLREIMLRRVLEDLGDVAPTERTTSRVSLTTAAMRDLDLIAAALDSETDRSAVVGQLTRYRRLVGKFKAAAACVVALRDAKTHPVVLWVWHKSVAATVVKTLSAARDGVWLITGDVKEDAREDLLAAWRQHPTGILVMSMAVGQAGIDLSHAHSCVFVELDWTPAVIGQAEMRTYTPTRPNRVVYVVADHDLDERLVGVLAKKCDNAAQMGTPAADTAVDVLHEALHGRNPNEADLDGLAARMAAELE